MTPIAGQDLDDRIATFAGVIIILPPSESKAGAPQRGRPVDLESLSFPELTPTRARVLDALVATSSRRDALTRLLVRESVAAEVERNIHLRRVPTRPALEVYTGALFSALDPVSLSTAAKRRAARRVIVVSPLWGALRPTDRIPPYRLNICADLVGLGALEPLWRRVLGPLLTEAAGRSGLFVDLRSPSFQAAGKPAGVGDRVVTIAVVRPGGGRGASGHVAKRIRGEVVRHLLESGANPSSPEELATAVGAAWGADLAPPSRSGHPWTLRVAASG